MQNKGCKERKIDTLITEEGRREKNRQTNSRTRRKHIEERINKLIVKQNEQKRERIESSK